jgi:hypothetical protein
VIFVLIIFCRAWFSARKQARLGLVPLDGQGGAIDLSGMGFNRRELEDQRREAAEKKAASRRATDAQVLEDAERGAAIRAGYWFLCLIAAWNERQAKRMPMLFSPRTRPMVVTP